jgi:hypothetical protein
MMESKNENLLLKLTCKNKVNWQYFVCEQIQHNILISILKFLKLNWFFKTKTKIYWWFCIICWSKIHDKNRTKLYVYSLNLATEQCVFSKHHATHDMYMYIYIHTYNFVNEIDLKMNNNENKFYAWTKSWREAKFQKENK